MGVSQDKNSLESNKAIDFEAIKREQVRGFINILEDAYRRLDWITLHILHYCIRRGSFILMDELVLRAITGLGLKSYDLSKILGWLARRRLISIKKIVVEDPPEPKKKKSSTKKKKKKKEWTDMEVSLTEAGRRHYVDLVYCLAKEKSPEIAEDLKKKAEELVGVKVEDVDCGVLLR